MSNRKLASHSLLVIGAVASIATSTVPTGWILQRTGSMPSTRFTATEHEKRFQITVELVGGELPTGGALEAGVRYMRPDSPMGNVPLHVTLVQGTTVLNDFIAATTEGVPPNQIGTSTELWLTCEAVPCTETYEMRLARTDGSTVEFALEGGITATAVGGDEHKVVPVPEGTDILITAVELPLQ
jgi:hypothetical protein